MKRIVAALIAALLFIGVAAASGGTLGDPLISRDYISGVFLPDVIALLSRRAADATDGLYYTAAERLDGVVSDYIESSGVPEGSAAALHTTITFSKADTLAAPTGTVLLHIAGRAAITQGKLIDLTSGIELSQGESLTPLHRYVSVRDGTIVTIASDAARIAPQGRYAGTPSGEESTPFCDVYDGDWFYGSVQYVYARGLFTGTNEFTFDPSRSMTRAMLATVLHRLSGDVSPTPDAGFSDVAPGTWYSEPVNWAARHGIVNGTGDGVFSPVSSVTREQMAVMLYRYAGDYLGLGTDLYADIGLFPDASSVSSWAVDAVRWAVASGIITGKTGGYLDPLGTANRAEVATMLERFSRYGG